MPLIQCPDCEKSVSDKAQHCIHCGCPMQSHSSTSEAPVAATPYPSLELTARHAVTSGRPASQRCPKCGGSAFKKVSFIYEEQRSTGTAKSSTLGVGIGSSGAIGVGGASTSTHSVSVTDLARRVAPPAEQHPSGDLAGVGGVIIGLVIGLIGGSFVLGLFAAAIGGILLHSFLTAKYGPKMKADYEGAYTKWDKQFLCLQCGNSVVLDSTGEIQSQVEADDRLSAG